MHGHVRRVGDQIARGIEQRAGEIEAFLDVHGMGGIGEPQAHLFSDGHEQVVEEFEAHRIDARACGVARGTCLDAREHQMVCRRHFELPARFNDGGDVGFGDDCRSEYAVTWL